MEDKLRHIIREEIKSIIQEKKDKDDVLYDLFKKNEKKISQMLSKDLQKLNKSRIKDFKDNIQTKKDDAEDGVRTAEFYYDATFTYKFSNNISLPMIIYIEGTLTQHYREEKGDYYTQSSSDVTDSSFDIDEFTVRLGFSYDDEIKINDKEIDKIVDQLVGDL